MERQTWHDTSTLNAINKTPILKQTKQWGIKILYINENKG